MKLSRGSAYNSNEIFDIGPRSAEWRINLNSPGQKPGVGKEHYPTTAEALNVQLCPDNRFLDLL